MTDKGFEPNGLTNENISGNSENKTERKSQPEEELLSLGRQTGNELKILEKKKEANKFLEPDFDIFENKKFSSADVVYLFRLIKLLRSYIDGPIITDSFNENQHPQRREWEKNLDQASPEANKYYSENKLARNRFLVLDHALGGSEETGSQTGLLDLDHEYNLSPEIKEKMVFWRKEFGLLDGKYNEMKLAEKLDAVKRFTAIAQDLLDNICQKGLSQN